MQAEGDCHVFLLGEEESGLLPITESHSKCLHSNITSTMKQSSKQVGEGWMRGRNRLWNRNNIETM